MMTLDPSTVSTPPPKDSHRQQVQGREYGDEVLERTIELTASFLGHSAHLDWTALAPILIY